MRTLPLLAGACLAAAGFVLADGPQPPQPPAANTLQPPPKPTLPPGTPAEQVKAVIGQYDTASAEFREYHPIKQAATVQHQFLQIFPFPEHSGKVGRMCTNLILLRHNYLPCIIHSIDRQKYYEAFRGTVANFRTLLMDAMENSIDNALKYFREHQLAAKQL